MEITIRNKHLEARAVRAALDRHRVLWYEGGLWRVRAFRSHHLGLPISWATLEPAYLSIDDCTPAEWDAAARAARETC